MKKFLHVFLLSLFSTAMMASGDTPLVINEVDADTPGSDEMEFVELYGPANYALDGLVLVFWNGSDDASSGAFDLDGYSLDENGFFVAGNAAVPNVSLVFPGNTIQNGADAVALHIGDEVDYPTDTPVSNANLIDAIVYGTDDSDATVLLSTLLNAGQPQVNESSTGASDMVSNARVPDGGTALNTDTYVQQEPTPGVSNQQPCDGGTVSTTEGEDTFISLCVNETVGLVNLENTGGGSEDTYVYLITDQSNVIIELIEGTAADFNGSEPGTCRIWGLSFTGTLDATTTEPGDIATEVQTSGDCIDLSSNFLEVEKLDCSIPICDGGEVTSDQGSDVIVCLDGQADVLTFSTTNSATAENYIYVVTDENNIILSVLADNTNDFNQAAEGVCRVWGLSYDGTLNASTTEAGDDATMVETDGECLALSSNFVTVIRQQCDDNDACGLFFSEYIEGSSNNKALEIFNPTSAAISLADYELVSCSNGCDPEGEFEFTNDVFGDAILMPGEVFVVGHPDADPAIANEADATLQFLSNGNDVYALRNIASGEIVDIIGTTTATPPTGWTVSGVENGTQNHTLVRMFDINEGSGDWTIVQDQWDVYDQDEFSFIGSHDAVPCGNVAEDCGIFFSEYIEGSSNNKALEIYNPTSTAVSLSDYELVSCSNGCDPEGEFEFTNDVFGDAVLMPGEVFIIGHPDADPAIANEADATLQFLSNGNDVYALKEIISGEIIDIIGTTTATPPTGWTVSGVENGTQNHTLVRLFSVTEGTSDWSIGQDQWIVYDQDDFAYIGFHDSEPCGEVNMPIVGFTSSSQTVDEAAGTVSVSVQVNNPSDQPITVELALSGGSATEGDDFTASLPVTLSFPANSSDPIVTTINIVDDMDEEPAETIELSLTGDEMGYTFGIEAQIITIEPSDITVPVYDIGEINTVDAEGVPDSLGVLMELRGIVHGTNLNPFGFQFSLIDETGAITIYSGGDNFGYTVTEGDSVHITGTLGQFNGLTQLVASGAELISTDHPLVEPDLVTELNEETESDLVRINCVTIVDPTDWTGSGSGFNVEVTDGTNSYMMRIDADVDLYDMPVPEGSFDLIGLGGQFDSSVPYTEGYQILPRYSADITNQIVADFEAPNNIPILIGGGTVDVDFVNNSTGASYEWDFGDGGTSAEENPTHTYVYDSSEPSSYEVTLTVFDEDGDCSTTMTMTIDVDYITSVAEYEMELSIFPNPVKDQVTVNSSRPIQSIVIFDAVGKEVLRTDADSGRNIVIPMSEFNAGIYLIQIQGENSIKTSRLIKK